MMLRLDKFFSFLLSLLFLMQSKKLLIVLSIYLNELNKKSCFKKLNLLRSYVVVYLALKGFVNKGFCHDALLTYKVEICT